ncbi:MAG: hypothetical protein QOK49_4692 [Baekduia sp.]|nr:hypothetical protein [Baekduia sp.]
MESIEPIRPGPPSPDRIPAIRRSDGSTQKRERDGAPPRKKRPPALPVPPPDDGLPHIDVRV